MKEQSKDSSSTDNLLQLYSILFDKFNQEGDGIWNRFNIMFTINTAILGGLVYIYFLESSPPWRIEILIGLCIVGLLLAVWSLHVLKRLWFWHDHWRNLLAEMETTFPSDNSWPQPHKGMIEKGNRLRRVWVLRYTQPFLLVLIAAWSLLLILLVGKYL